MKLEDAKAACQRWLDYLERQKEKCSPAYRIIAEYFDDLLHGRYSLIKKKMQIASEELMQAIQKLARLELRPAARFQKTSAPTALADIKAVKILYGNEFPCTFDFYGDTEFV